MKKNNNSLFLTSLSVVIMILGFLCCSIELSFAQKRLDGYGVLNPNSELYTKVSQSGAWCWFSDPRAIYVDGKLIGGYVDDKGSVWAFLYDPQNNVTENHKIFNELNYDDHANPSFLQRPDGRVTIFFSAHGGTNNGPIYYTTTKKGIDISEWEPLQEVDPKMKGGFGLCYTNPMTLSEEDNKTYLFFRGKDFKPTWVDRKCN